MMFIGRNPGRKEFALQSQPFEPTAACGRLFEKQITRIGLRRQDVWVTNLVLGYTSNDRVPTQDEISNCLPYLLRQIEHVKPKVVVTIGIHASRQLLGQHYSWKRDHGHPACVQLGAIKMVVVPITHPGQAVRGMYHEIIDDFDVVKTFL